MESATFTAFGENKTMKKVILLVAMLLASCSTCQNEQSTEARRYGQECFGKPYTDSRDTQALCMTAALAKYNQQSEIIND